MPVGQASGLTGASFASKYLLDQSISLPFRNHITELNPLFMQESVNNSLRNLLTFASFKQAVSVTRLLLLFTFSMDSCPCPSGTHITELMQSAFNAGKRQQLAEKPANLPVGQASGLRRAAAIARLVLRFCRGQLIYVGTKHSWHGSAHLDSSREDRDSEAKQCETLRENGGARILYRGRFSRVKDLSWRKEVK